MAPPILESDPSPEITPLTVAKSRPVKLLSSTWIWRQPDPATVPAWAVPAAVALTEILMSVPELMFVM